MKENPVSPTRSEGTAGDVATERKLIIAGIELDYDHVKDRAHGDVCWGTEWRCRKCGWLGYENHSYATSKEELIFHADRCTAIPEASEPSLSSEPKT